MKKILSVLIVTALFFSCVSTKPVEDMIKELPGRISHNGQELFLSGMNLAWISFGRDLTKFNEEEFIGALDEIAATGANSVRWWIHINGSSTPLWNGHFVTGMPDNTLDNFERALDLAWERGILIMPTLWSFDMLQEQSQMDPIRNKEFLEDPEAVQSYLDNALTPIIERVGNHKAVVAWEVFNEPEGMVEQIGWSEHRVTMKTVQSFVNKVAGRIHEINPDLKVTNGTKDMSTQTDIAGYKNYYSNERLIAEGGNPLGYLDFYQVHFYPAHMGDGLSPFHKAKSYWQLDKPLIIGEFPAIGIVDYGSGFKPSTTLSPEESYRWAMDMGYAGALAWTWTAHEAKFGSTASAQPGMMSLQFKNRDAIKVDNGNVDWIPVRIAEIKRLLVPFNHEPMLGYTDLASIFKDKEDGTDLTYTISNNSSENVVNVSIEGTLVNLTFPPGESGKTTVTFAATDKSGNQSSAKLEIVVVDPDRGNIALFKPVTTSTTENETNSPDMINDGLSTTRYSSEYEDGQWAIIDLEGTFNIYGASITWEAAHGKVYDMEVSTDGETWTKVFTEEGGVEGLNEYSFDKINASFVRLNMIERGTDWGFSIWEIEVLGERVK